MTAPPNSSGARCVNCGVELTADRCTRCGRPRVLPLDYLSKMEDLARQIVQAAVAEDSFDVFSDDDSKKTPLQRSISRVASGLLFWHYSGDGCLHNDDDPEALEKESAEVKRLLLDALERMDDQVIRKNWGNETPSPKKLIREGLSIARRAIEEVPLSAPSYFDAVLRALQAARDRQDACGVSDDGWRDENGYILSGIAEAVREVERLRRE
jgi:hypothetical protein